MKEKHVKRILEKGITLIALVVTIVVLLILAGVSITLLFGDSGIIKMAQEAANKTQQSADKDQADLDELNKYLTSGNWEGTNSPTDPENPPVQTIDAKVQIQVNVVDFNSNVEEFSTVYKIIGKCNNSVVYENIVLIKVNEQERHPIINIVANVPKGTVLTVESVYPGASYQLMTEQIVEKTLDENETVECNFEYKYCGKLIKNDGMKI